MRCSPTLAPARRRATSRSSAIGWTTLSPGCSTTSRSRGWPWRTCCRRGLPPAKFLPRPGDLMAEVGTYRRRDGAGGRIGWRSGCREAHRHSPMCRVERWRGGLGGPICCRPFRLPVPQCPHHAPFPPPAHRTGRAVFPHPALGQGHAFAHGKLRVQLPADRPAPTLDSRYWSRELCRSPACHLVLATQPLAQPLAHMCCLRHGRPAALARRQK